MLEPAQNRLVTRTGPGTPMGDLFRRYWIPAMQAEELPENECPPVRVKLLSERLLAWRDTQGRFALTDEFCAHRGVSLWFGRNEQNGLRCPYHGWKYDHTGQCIEVPSEPSESGFCQKIKLKSYPLVERGGILWAYMGPPEKQPPFPEFEWATRAGLASSTSPSAAGMQLPAGDGGRHRFQPCVVPALRRHAPRSAAPQHQGRALPARPEAEVRDRANRPGGLSIARATQRRGGALLLAHHPVDHALVHDGAALRRQRAQRARLGADRRRELLHLDLHLSSDAAAVRHGARRDAQGRRHPCAAESRARSGR